MTYTTFELGDVVRLKSGSPKMTIEGLNNGNKVASLVWFTKDFDLKRSNIDARFLIKEEQ